MAGESAPPPSGTSRQAPPLSSFDATASPATNAGTADSRSGATPNAGVPPAGALSRFSTAVALTALCVVGVAYGTRTPDAASASAPLTSFSAQRAMRHVRAIAERPHPTGSQD